jgi:putative (di)nucleoside polyphosphate hydrolase
MGKDYRASVVAVIIREDNQVLVFERFDRPGSWQFPQGGLEFGEDPEAALMRELKEEIGCDQLTILKKSAKLISYDFPNCPENKLRTKFRGQRQTWFLLSFMPDAMANLQEASDREFLSFEWVSWQEALSRIVDWKKNAYKEGLSSLGFIEG